MRGAAAVAVALAALAHAGGAKEALVRLDDTAVPLEERVKAAEALGASKDAGALDALLLGLESRSEALRGAVVKALGRQGGGAALCARASDAALPLASRRLALRGLRALKPKDAGPTLTALLSSPDAPLRADAALALAVVGAAEARPALIAALDDADKDVRSFAATALGTTGAPEALAAVTARQAKEAEPVVQDALAQAARKLAARPDAGAPRR